MSIEPDGFRTFYKRSCHVTAPKGYACPGPRFYRMSKKVLKDHQCLSFTSSVYIVRAILAAAATMAERLRMTSSPFSFLSSILPPFLRLKNCVTGESLQFLTCPMVAWMSSHLAWGSPVLVIPHRLIFSEEFLTLGTRPREATNALESLKRPISEIYDVR